jgi:hypothetical protein
MMQMDWKKELYYVSFKCALMMKCEGGLHVATKELDLERNDGLCDPDGGEDAAEDQRALVVPGVKGEQEGEQQTEEERAPNSQISPPERSDGLQHSHNIPQVPITQPLAHAALQHNIRVRPPTHQTSQRLHSACKTTPFASLRTTNPTTALHHAAQEVLGPQYLPHLLPHCQQISLQRFPYRFIDRIKRCTAVFAGDSRC